jgi:hypothetical protein
VLLLLRLLLRIPVQPPGLQLLLLTARMLLLLLLLLLSVSLLLLLPHCLLLLLLLLLLLPVASLLLLSVLLLLLCPRNVPPVHSSTLNEVKVTHHHHPPRRCIGTPLLQGVLNDGDVVLIAAGVHVHTNHVDTLMAPGDGHHKKAPSTGPCRPKYCCTRHCQPLTGQQAASDQYRHSCSTLATLRCA